MFKYTFKFRDKQGYHTGTAESAADLRRQIYAITRQGGEIPTEEIRVNDKEKSHEQR